MKFHELSEIFPLIEGEDMKELVQSVRENGLRHPIVTYQGQILDGRNRFLACKKAGVEPVFTSYEGTTPLREVVLLNVSRRHLTTSQRAIAAAKIANMQAHRPGPLTESIDSVSRTDAAHELKIGTASVIRAKKLMREAPELVAAVERGELTVNAALEQKKRKPKITPESHPTISVLSISTEMSTTARRIRKFIETNPELSKNSEEIIFDDATDLMTTLNELLQKYRPSKPNLQLVKES